MKRVLYGLAIVIAAFVVPWWIAVILAIAGIFYFDNLYEVILVGMIIDLLYGSHFNVYGVDIIFTLTLTVTLFVLTNIKKRILI